MKQTVCIYFTYHTWHHLLDISYERESEKCHSNTLEQLCCHIKNKIKWTSEPNERDIQYPIAYLIFVMESQSLCLTHVIRVKEASSYIYFAIEEIHIYFFNCCNAINVPGADRTPTHIWLYRCHSCVELENITWTKITTDSLTNSKNLRTVMLKVFVLRMEILRSQIDPTRRGGAMRVNRDAHLRQ